MEHSKTFRKLGDAEAWLEEERTNARRGGWIDPTRGNETLGSVYERKAEIAARRYAGAELANLQREQTAAEEDAFQKAGGEIEQQQFPRWPRPGQPARPV